LQLTVQMLDTVFFSLSFGVLGTTYNVHLGLIGKRVVDFLLALIELFSLGVTAESLRAKRLKIGDFAPRLIQHFRYKGSPPTNHFCTDS